MLCYARAGILSPVCAMRAVQIDATVGAIVCSRSVGGVVTHLAQ